mmetsp:Transcript_65044/g.151078  ORF Transcript_65044/g.151078 Transcript_65044/m.151078 type:complete len:200 (-) Transcript_65044:410-1009(-)
MSGVLQTLLRGCECLLQTLHLRAQPGELPIHGLHAGKSCGVTLLEAVHRRLVVIGSLLQEAGLLAQGLDGWIQLAPLVLPPLNASAHLGFALYHVLKVPLQAGRTHSSLVEELASLLQKQPSLREVGLQLQQIGASLAPALLEVLDIRDNLIHAAIEAGVHVFMIPQHARLQRLELALQAQKASLKLWLVPCSDVQLRL